MSDQSLNKLGSVTTIGAGDFIGIHKTGSGLRKCAGSNFMDLVPAGSTNVHITAYEKAKLAESTNVRWLIGTDSDSDNNNITDALADLTGTEGVLLVSGRFKINSTITPPNLTNLTIASLGWCEFYKGSATSEYRLIDRSTVPSTRTNIEIDGIIFTGDWLTRLAQGGDGSRLVSLDGYESVTFRRCKGRYSSQMGFTGVLNDRMNFIDCHMNDIGRDVFNASNCGYVRLIDCTAHGASDDFLGYNLSSTYKSTVNIQNGVIVRGCVWNQCNGLKILGARDILIAGNQAFAPRNYFAQIGYDESYLEGDRIIDGLQIVDNTVVDVLDDTITGQGAINTCILIDHNYSIAKAFIDRNNFISRTSIAAAAFSTGKLGYGFSSRISHQRYRTVGYDDPTVTITPGSDIKAIRIECPEALDVTKVIITSNNYYEGMISSEKVSRFQWLYSGSYSWAIPSALTEFPTTHRYTVPSLADAITARLEISVGSSKGLSGSIVRLQYSIDGGSTWTALTSITINASSSYYYGTYVTVPTALKSATNAVFRIVGLTGNGSTALTVVGLGVRVTF